MKNVDLSSPWYTLQRRLSYTIGVSGQFMVSKLNDTEDKITIYAQAAENAQALVNVIKTQFSFGGHDVNVKVQDLAGNVYIPKATPNTLKDKLSLALVNNPIIYGIELYNKKESVICTPSVVQYYNDVFLGNPYAFESLLAADAFKYVLKEGIEVYMIGKNIGNF